MPNRFLFWPLTIVNGCSSFLDDKSIIPSIFAFSLRPNQHPIDPIHPSNAGLTIPVLGIVRACPNGIENQP